MADLIRMLQQMSWFCSGCGQPTRNPYVRWNYEGAWCETCYRPPPTMHAGEWYQVSDVVRLLKESGMDTQGWWEELVAQLSDPRPNRETVIEVLQELLDAIQEGDPLPRHSEEE
jgi:hypothetical protein